MDPILEKVDKSLEAILAGQNEAREKIASLEKEHGGVAARLMAIDDKIRSADAWRNDVEQRFAKSRYTNGSDELLGALPADLRTWIPRVKGIEAGQLSEAVRQFPGLAAGMVRFAQKDPVLYVATAGWFQSKIKAALATKMGNPAKASEWNERGEKLAEALGGILGEAKAALQEDTNSEGGYLVPTITEAVIGWLMKEASVVRQAGATVMQMTAKTHQLPSLASDFTVSWTAEEGTITDAVPATPFSQGSLVAKKQTGLVTVSIELIQDNIVNLMDFVMAHLIQQIGRAEDAQALEGDGTTFSGLYSAAGVNSVAGGSAALTEVMLRKLIYGGEHASTLDGGVIFAHPWIMRDALGLAISSGSPWFPIIFGQGQQGNGHPNNIWGVPALLTSIIARNRGGGTNETTAYFGKPQYIVIGDRLGTTFDVNPWSETEFKKGQILLRLVRRVGILVWVPGHFTKLTAVTVSA